MRAEGGITACDYKDYTFIPSISITLIPFRVTCFANSLLRGSCFVVLDFILF